MSFETTRCPKCKGEMEPGFLLDRADADLPHAAEWMEGAPEKSFWTGLKTKGKERFPVRTHRCRECGFLESYAKKA
ncbi:MAG TPA: PF20097 family protein [Candidatus Eisenbacteria bacterium]|nr:PF20097 family protein [Candidatus Eisenbacteria bacterium]